MGIRGEMTLTMGPSTMVRLMVITSAIFVLKMTHIMMIIMRTIVVRDIRQIESYLCRRHLQQGRVTSPKCHFHAFFCYDSRHLCLASTCYFHYECGCTTLELITRRWNSMLVLKLLSNHWARATTTYNG